MPIGSFTTSTEKMHSLREDPMLGHITTFGGHPIVCAASLATLDELCETQLFREVEKKETLFRALLNHPKIKEIRGKGLMLAIELDDAELCQKVVHRGIEHGDYHFLFLVFENSCKAKSTLNDFR